MKVFELKRDSYQKATTLGEMFSPDGSHFGYTLEDIVRPYGIKDKDWTAIPEGMYHLGIRISPKYGEVAVAYTHKIGERYILENNGQRFEYILIHGGNNKDHTSGCVLIARNRNDQNLTIQGSLKEEFAAEVKRLIKEGHDVRLRVTNLPQDE